MITLAAVSGCVLAAGVGVEVVARVMSAGHGCTVHTERARPPRSVRPGAVICLARNRSGDRLDITAGGTPDAPVTYDGRGRAVGGITIEADNVVVRGYRVDRPAAPGIEMTGNNITVRGNTVTAPRGGDGDGLRFFGGHLEILDNTITDTSNRYGHADCMQTFASDTPPSHDVLIAGNRCVRIDNMCLMAEGPNDGEGDGVGHTRDITVRDNSCQTRTGSQGLMFEDVQGCVIVGNRFAAGPDHAIGLAIGSTGARVRGNTVSPRINYVVGIDASSMPGYHGPTPGGAP